MSSVLASSQSPSPNSSAPSIALLYRHVWRHAAGRRAHLCAALVMLAASQLLKLAMPWMAAQAINTLQASGRAGMATAGAWIAGILGLYAGVWALHGPGRVIERNVALRVRHRYADALFARLSRAPLSWLDQHHSGDLQHRAQQSASALFGFTQSQFIYLQAGVNLAGPLVALMLLSRVTGTLAIVGYALVALAILRFDVSLMLLASDENAAERRYSARMLDFIANMPSVMSLRLQHPARRMLEQRLLAVFEPLKKSIVLNEWKWCSVDLFSMLMCWSLVVAYAVSATSGPGAVGATLMLGSLFMIQQYAQQAAGVITSMAANFQNLARTRTDFASASQIWDAPQRESDGSVVQQDWHRIELQGLSYTHPVRAAHPDGTLPVRMGVRDVHLTLRRGERIALVGPSGCGKSTLLRLLAGLYDAQAGRIAVDGSVGIGLRHLGSIATLIPQEADVFEASVRENLVFDKPVDEAVLRGALHVSAFDAVLQGMPQGLDTPMSERGFNLSGGQRQRLALARGVLAARHSSLLLLDEPTSALDAPTELRVHDRIQATFCEACIVACVHRMSLLAHFDRIVFMAEGSIVDVGTVAELAERQPLFARMLNSHEAAHVDARTAQDDASDFAPTSPGPLGPLRRAS